MKNPFESGKIRVTSVYGKRGDAFHKGMDLVGVSSLRVVAVEDATVGVSTIITDHGNRTWEWGNYVRLDLDDGRRLYHCHLANRLVKTGERVRKGQVLGIAGETGNATGVHLHWELRPAGYSTESLNISEWSGIPNKIGTYDPSPTESAPETPSPAPGKESFYVGETVKIKQGAVYTNGVKVPKKYLGVPYTVEEVKPGRVLIAELYSWVADEYLEKAAGSSGADAVIRVGDRVKIVSGAKYTNGVKVPARYLGVPMTVAQVREGRVLISELNSWVPRQYVEKI